MKVQDFINYQTVCPVCENNTLNLNFLSKRQILHRDGERLIVIFDLGSLKKGQKHYKVGYSIDKQTNDFCIEFYDKDSIDYKYYNEAPLFLLNRFREYNDSQQVYRFYKHCLVCKGYSYSSKYFRLDLSNPNLGEINVDYEVFNYLHMYNNKQYNVVIRNEYDSSSFSIHPPDQQEFNMFNAPRIKFTNPEEIGNKLLKLLIFS
jgi:hypothetical protein